MKGILINIVNKFLTNYGVVQQLVFRLNKVKLLIISILKKIKYPVLGNYSFKKFNIYKKPVSERRCMGMCVFKQKFY